MTLRSRILTQAVLVVLMSAALPAEFAQAEAVVAVRAIRGSQMIGPEDVAVSEEADAPGAIRDPAAVIGQEAKVTLYPGRPILQGQIGTPAIVERNQLVKMIYSEGPLNIATDGRTLDRAGVGEMVRVMNLTSRQVVTGSVEPDGTIRVAR